MKSRRLFQRCMLLLVFVQVSPAFAYQLAGWDVHGTLSQGWIHSSKNNFIEDSKQGTFDFREFGVNASRSLGESVSVGAQLFGRDFGVVGNDDLYLDWLYIAYTHSDALNVRVGKMKLHYGLYGANRDVDSLRTQILLPQGVYLESYRGSANALWGGAVSGSLRDPRWGGLEYSLMLGRTSVNEDSGEISRLASNVELDIDQWSNDESAAAELMWYSPSRNWRVGATYSRSAFSASGPSLNFNGFMTGFAADIDAQEMYVGSIQYIRGNTTLTSEYYLGSVEAEFELDNAFVPTLDFEVELEGFYVNIDHRIGAQLTVGLGYSDLALQQELRSDFTDSRVDKKNDDLFFSVRWDITPSLIAKVEQHYIDGLVALVPMENPDGLDDKWSMTLFKLSFVF